MDMSKTSFSSSQTNRENKLNQRLLAVVAVLLVIGALKITHSVSLPLAFGLFLVAVFWPVYGNLSQKLPRWLSAALTLGMFLGIISVFVFSLWYSVEMVVDAWPKYSGRFGQYQQQVESFLGSFGINLSSQGGNNEAKKAFFEVSQKSFAMGGAFVLVIAFFVLGLLEVPQFKEKLESLSSKTNQNGPSGWKGFFKDVTRDFYRYIVVRTLVGAITGGLVWILSLAFGLELAFLWGFTNFLLNYIPTLGSIIAVIPPALFALMQFEEFGKAIGVLLGVGGVQVIMGAYIDPLLQGRYLKLSALVVLISVSLWGWIWGVAGAFISMPIMVFIVLATRRFPRTKWISTLLADIKDERS